MSGFTYRSLPVWLQWLLPLTVGAALVAALIWFVHHQTYDVPANIDDNNQAAVVEQNREDTILVRQQQAPHVAKLASGVSVIMGARSAVRGSIESQISHGTIAGPVRSARCTAAGGPPGRQILHCAVTASVQALIYRFDVVAEPAASRITYCKVVEPAAPGLRISLSRRCT